MEDTKKVQVDVEDDFSYDFLNEDEDFIGALESTVENQAQRILELESKILELEYNAKRTSSVEKPGILRLEDRLIANMFAKDDLAWANKLLTDFCGDVDKFRDWLLEFPSDDLAMILKGEHDIVAMMYQFLNYTLLDYNDDIVDYIANAATDNLYSNFRQTEIQYSLFDDNEFIDLLVDRSGIPIHGKSTYQLVMLYLEDKNISNEWLVSILYDMDIYP